MESQNQSFVAPLDVYLDYNAFINAFESDTKTLTVKMINHIISIVNVILRNRHLINAFENYHQKLLTT